MVSSSAPSLVAGLRCGALTRDWAAVTWSRISSGSLIPRPVSRRKARRTGSRSPAEPGSPTATPSAWSRPLRRGGTAETAGRTAPRGGFDHPLQARCLASATGWLRASLPPEPRHSQRTRRARRGPRPPRGASTPLPRARARPKQQRSRLGLYAGRGQSGRACLGFYIAGQQGGIIEGRSRSKPAPRRRSFSRSAVAG